MEGNTAKGRANLPLGTTEAAVRSCVSVIAAVTAQSEEILAYWLDLYYQVRRAYEVEQEREEDPRLIRREDLYPVMREMMRDALKSTAKTAAEKRAARKIASAAGGAGADPEEAIIIETGSAADPSGSATGEPRVNGWAGKKVLIRDRLLQARADGVTIAELEQTGGVFSREILGILEGAPIEMKSYRRVEAALDALGK